jgi:Protein of unknown function (DUF4239)
VSPVLVLGILAASVLISIAFLVATRRNRHGWWADPGRAAGVLGAARSPFAVILAFVILVGFQRFDDAQTSAQREADAVRAMFKEADFFDTAAREQIQANLLCYGRAVVALDWPAMSRESSSTRVDELEGYLDSDLRSVQITDPVQTSALGEMFKDENARDESRADRIAGADEGVPQPVWIVLIAGALGVMAFVLLFADPAERLLSQAVMVGSVAVIIVGGLLLIWFLSHPYRDEPGSIRPKAMERTLTEVEHDPAFEARGVSPHCDSSGRSVFSDS